MNQLERITLENQILIMQVLKEMTSTTKVHIKKLNDNIKTTQNIINTSLKDSTFHICEDLKEYDGALVFCSVCGKKL